MRLRALLGNSRKTDSLPAAAFALLTNSRKTDSLPAARSIEFLLRLAPPASAFALLTNSRKTNALLFLPALLFLAGQDALPGAAAAPQYTIQTFAGSDLAGDGGPAAAAQLAGAEGVAVDAAGNLYVSDSIDHRIRKITPAGLISTVAGNGHRGFRGDGGTARDAQLDSPYGLALDSANNLYVADLGNGRVRRISPDGIIRTVAGGGQGAAGSGGSDALSAKLMPRNVAAARDGTLYISDFRDHRIIKVTPEGRIGPVAGTGVAGLDEGNTDALTSRLNAPAGLALDAAGALWVADSGNGRVRKIENGRMFTVMGGERPSPLLATPTAVAVDAGGNLFVADSGNVCVRKRLPGGAVFTLAPASSPAPGSEHLQAVRDLALEPSGSLFIAARARVYRLWPSGHLTAFAGTGSFGFLGDGQPALEARLFYPRSTALSASGDLYIADQRNHRIRVVTAAGRIGTFAGTGEQGDSGDGRFATLARLVSPAGVAADAAGNLWLADEGGHRVRRVNPEGIITTAAGTGARGMAGDGGPAWAAQLAAPLGVALDSSGAAYIADSLNHRVRRLGPDGRLTTVAGNGIRGFGGGGGPAVEAQLDTPSGIAAGPGGDVYFSESANHCVRRIKPGGTIETVAGTGEQGNSGDGGPAAKALLNRPSGIAVDDSGNLFIADSGSHRIRMVDGDGNIHTIAGTGKAGFSGDGGPAPQAELDEPAGVTAARDGSLYVADLNNHRIRKLVRAPAPAPGPAPTPAPPETLPPEPVAREPVIQALTVLNSASLSAGAIAPGQRVTIPGEGLGPATAAAAAPDASGMLGTSLGGVKVLFDGIPAPVLYAQSAQVQAQAPYRLAGQTSTLVEVYVQEVKRGEALVAVAPAAPGLFTLSQSKGQAFAHNQDGSVNSATNPAPLDSVVSFYATGEGVVNPVNIEGRPAREPLPVPAAPVSVTVGGLPAEVVFAASAPGTVGVMQVNVRLPAGHVPSGALPVVLLVGSIASQPGVYLSVR